MKKILLGLILCISTTLISYAQCDKKVTLTGSRTEYLGADSSVQRTEDEHSLIEFDKNNITIIPGNEDHKMNGTITSATCNWQTPFKEGKTVLKVALDDNDKKVNITITITGKDGKISFLAEVDNDPNKKIRLVVDTFEEKAG